MSRPYRLVVFDWEGTLCDTLGHILHTISIVSERMQLGGYEEALARQSVSYGLIVTVKKLFPRLTLYEQDQFIQAVQDSLVNDPVECCLIPGAKQVVQAIQKAGMDLAIASNKGHASLQKALQASGLDKFFHLTRSAGQFPAKPCPHMLEDIMAISGARASQTLMVGDSVSDVEMARQVNVDVIGFDFYHQQTANLRAAGAVDVFENYQQLARYLLLPEK